MKITKVSCEQFAGVRNRRIDLTDGINVIYGKNESGKSTFVNLISRTLFQKAKLDGRSDKYFIDNYFPTAKRGSSRNVGFADGAVTLTVGDDSYTVKKEWSNDSRATLSSPDGVVRGDAIVADVLKDVLGYGEGVYTDILFSSQTNAYPALQSILDASKKTDAKQDILGAVSQAFAESDGVSLDAVEQGINERISTIAGEHWDFDRKAPKKGKMGRWSKGLGEILKAYYDLDDARTVLAEISRLESAADSANADFSKADAAYNDAENKYHDFGKYSTALTLQSERKKAAARISADIGKLNAALSDWPVLKENVCKAKALEVEAENRNAFDLYNATKEKQTELGSMKAEIMEMRFPEIREIQTVKTAQQKIMELENKLCGMNLTASVRTLGGHSVELRSLRTGEPLDVKHITEAVSITVPGVLEMQLAPANVDIAAVESLLREQRSIITGTFGKYNVSTEDELESLRGTYIGLQNKIDAKEKELFELLGGKCFGEVEAAAPTMVRSREEIDADIAKLCEQVDLSRYVIMNDASLKRYKDEYIDIANLKMRIYDLQTELKKTNESLLDVESIPVGYRGIADPEKFLDILKSDSESKKELREKALLKKSTAETTLENYRNTASDDPAADVEKAERAFREKEELLSHWLHISEAFSFQKEALSDSPLVGLAEDFARYLSIISDNRISSEFPNADKLNMNLYSADREIDFTKLSEGSKETVSLAFRLAVLDYLFPDGGGVIVLDDPFVNMDPERTEKSVALVKDCATRHQIIFLTCKEEYPKILGGNLIRI